MTESDISQPAVAPADAEAPALGEFPPVVAGVYCPDCGYDLRGLTGARCPECGLDLEIVRTQEPQIPWSRRRELGRFRAYWRTVFAVSLRGRKVCLEMVRPVSYRDSQSFRWVTFLHAYLPILIVTAGLRLLSDEAGSLVRWVDLFETQLAAIALLAGLSGLASYFFHPHDLPVERQNRAIALSYYAWSPLAWMPVAAAPLAVGTCIAAVGGRDQREFADVLAVFSGLVCLAVALRCMLNVYSFARRTLLHSHARTLLRMGVLLGLAALYTGLALVAASSVSYILIVYYSLV